MEFTLNSFSIVVQANANNPTILNPDFLKINGIVDEARIPVEVFCTPPISKIRYKDKFNIVVDAEHLRFNDNDMERIPEGSPIPTIASNYVKTLAHTPYKAVGINFTGFCDCSHRDPNSILLDKFVKNGVWSNYGGVNPQVGLSFSYDMANIVHNLSLSVTEITMKKEQRVFPSIVFNSNFHCKPDTESNLTGEIIKYIGDWGLRYEMLAKLLNEFFKEQQ